ncbi:MAG: pentapeptide repeat-containing protein [Planctomycetota bacterium]|nr:pentapeptide repeat-containing protein [Planctomycetota bacterium]
MVCHFLKYRQIGIVTFALLFLVLMFSHKLQAQQKGSKFTLFEEPSVKLGRWARDLKVGPGMNAVGKHLKGSEFVGQNLQGAIFDDCDLDGVRFNECDLSQASFKGACLTGVYIAASGLKGADFSEAILNGAKLASSSLSKEQLKSTHSYKTKNLNDCVISAREVYPLVSDKPLVKYDFRKANLYDAYLTNGDFSNCDFTDAGIGNIRLSNARITAKQLASTQSYQRRNLRHMSFMNFLTSTRGPCAIYGRIDFSGIDLTGTRFRGSPLDADFSDSTITDCYFDFTLTKEQLCSTRNYQEGNLSGIRLWHIDLSGCNLSRQNLTGCNLKRCDFNGTNFEDAIITDTNFGKKRDWECTGLTIGQIKSTWNYKHDRMEGITLPKDIAAVLDKERETKADKSKK